MPWFKKIIRISLQKQNTKKRSKRLKKSYLLFYRCVGNMRRYMTWTIWSIVIICVKLRTCLATFCGPIKQLVAMMRRTSTCLSKVRSRILEGIININVSWISTKLWISSTELFSQVKRTELSIRRTVLARICIVNAGFVSIDAPCGIRKFDEASDGWKFSSIRIICK